MAPQGVLQGAQDTAELPHDGLHVLVVGAPCAGEVLQVVGPMRYLWWLVRSLRVLLRARRCPRRIDLNILAACLVTSHYVTQY